MLDAVAASHASIAQTVEGRLPFSLTPEQVQALYLTLLRRERPAFGWMEAPLVAIEEALQPAHNAIHDRSFNSLNRQFFGDDRVRLEEAPMPNEIAPSAAKVTADAGAMPARKTEHLGGPSWGWEGEFNLGWNACLDALAHPSAAKVAQACPHDDPQAWARGLPPRTPLQREFEAVYGNAITSRDEYALSRAHVTGGYTFKQTAEEFSKFSTTARMPAKVAQADAMGDVIGYVPSYIVDEWKAGRNIHVHVSREQTIDHDTPIFAARNTAAADTASAEGEQS